MEELKPQEEESNLDYESFQKSRRCETSRTGRFARRQGNYNTGTRKCRLPCCKISRKEDGARIVAIIERDGAIINDAGFSVEKVSACKKKMEKLRVFLNQNSNLMGQKFSLIPAIF